MKFRFVSVCSGVEAASLALEPIGFEAASLSETNPFCCDLLKQRFPSTPNFGDLTKWRDWDLPEADMLIGGTPCQSFSVAGERKSLSDDRGTLSLSYVDLFHAGRFACALWENVPGVLNTDDNAFGCFLGGLVGTGDALPEPPDGRWPHAGMVAGPRARAAWRVLGAEHFGLAQRRNRVFVVTSARDWIDPAKIFFERQGVQGDFATGGETREDVAGTLSARTSDGGGLGADFELDGGLQVIAHCLKGEGFDASEDGTGRGVPLVPVAFRQSSEFGQFDDGLPTLRTSGGDCGQGGEALIPTLSKSLMAASTDKQDPEFQTYIPFAFDPVQVTSKENGSQPAPGKPCHTLPADSQAPCVAFYSRQSDVCAYGNQAGCLDTSEPVQAVQTPYGVRRLMPVECERLQGMPDHWTLIQRNGKPAADGPRYKAIGNSFAVPVVRWIGERIKAQFLAAQSERAA